MKILIIILVLFSSHAFGKIYNCTITILEGGDGKITSSDEILPYDILIDTGNEEDEDVLAILDYETGKFKNIVADIRSVGKIYFKKPSPFSFDNLDLPFYITINQSDFYTGFFFDDTFYPKIISIREYKNPTAIIIYDTFDLWGGIHKGICE